MKKPELLAPAGNLEKLKIALIYGADAVYVGGQKFCLRAFGDNFTNEELQAGVAFAHERGKKVYVAVNIFPHNIDLETLPAYLDFLRQIQVDGLIIADLGVYKIARQVAPTLPLHISTQANNVNWATVQFWQELGAERVILARELVWADIKLIRAKVNIELEVFIHGAICMAYSGRCLLSNYLTQRDANRGECAQPCRWQYYLMEETRPGQYYPVGEDERGTYILNAKDLCLLPYLPILLTGGLDSLKIEGRMKSVHYVATVVKVYRQAIDAFEQDPDHYVEQAEWGAELLKVSHRAYTSGFYFAAAAQDMQIYGSSSYQHTHEFVGLVLAYDLATGLATVEQRNKIQIGETLEICQPLGPPWQQKITAMYDLEGEPLTIAPHPQQIFKMRLTQPVSPYALLRRKL